MARKEDRRRLVTSQDVALLLVASLLILVLIAAGYAFGGQWTGFHDRKLFDWLQILVFPAAVAVGTFVLSRSARRREEARDKVKARNQDRKDLLTRATRAYNDTKKVRRILKAHVATNYRTKEKEISCTVYEEQLEKLMDPQLEFELYKGHSTFLHAFKNPEDIAGRLRELETYLHGVIQEYDGGKYQKHKEQVGFERRCRIRLKNFEKLDEFLNKDPFIEAFSSKFRSTAAEVQKQILDV